VPDDEADALAGQQVACVVNLESRRIGPFVSEVLALRFPDSENWVVLIGPEPTVPEGVRMF
jgi:tRNA-binding protein